MEMRYGELTGKILETLVDLTATSFDLFATIIEAGHGASYGQLQRKFSEVQERRAVGPHSKSKDFKRRRHNFYSLLYKLQKEGLVERQESRWSITKAGREKYKRIVEQLPLRRREYKREPDLTLKLVIFDVPEKEARKRVWLRERLGELGFKMLQKSVWIGKVKLPQEFLDNLKELEMLEWVEIIAITKTGSLRYLG